MSWRKQALGGGLTALLIGISAGGVRAQSALTGTVLSGATLSGGAGGSARLVLGSRVVSPPRSWTEVVFSDGSSIVLGPGAELAVHQNHVEPGIGAQSHQCHRQRAVPDRGGGRYGSRAGHDRCHGHGDRCRRGAAGGAARFGRDDGRARGRRVPAFTPGHAPPPGFFRAARRVRPSA